jgi:flagellar motor switch protein FliM
MAEGRDDVIRRKLGAAKAGAASRAIEGRPGPEKAWRLALARSARDKIKLSLDVTRLTLDRMSLAEVLELVPERGLIGVLEGPARALGVILLAPDVLAGMTEAQTIGIVTAASAPERRPTRTDAAMAAGMIDEALQQLEEGLKDQPDGAWAIGYRYASFLEDVRPLGLLLEELPYLVLRAQVSLAGGAKSGAIFMALPAETRIGAQLPPSELQSITDALLFTHEFAEQILAADCRLEGVLARISLRLSDVMEFEVEQILPLGKATLDMISLEGMDGRHLGDARLGQNRGYRALRMNQTLPAQEARPNDPGKDAGA